MRPGQVAEDAATRIGRLSRAEFVRQFATGHVVGDHVAMVGPTRHGKSVLTAQVLPAMMRHYSAVVLTPTGAEKAYAQLGRPTAVWPPRRDLTDMVAQLVGREPERPAIWRVEMDIRKPEQFTSLAAVCSRVLHEVLARPVDHPRPLLVVVDDSRMVSQFLGLKQILTMDQMMAGKKNVTIWNNFQGPRWVPREGLDQVAHTLLWRNRDVDVGKRLAELTGDLDLRAIDRTLRGLSFYEALWIDGRHDTMAIIGQD